MIRKIVLIMQIFCFIVFCNEVFAEKKVIFGSSEYVVTGTMNQTTIERLAMEAARKVAAESAGSLIISKTVVEKNVVQKDEIKVLLRAMAELIPGSEHKHYEMMNQTDNTRKLFYSASFTVDEEEFEKQVKALERNDKTIIQMVQKASKEYEKLVKIEQQYQKDYSLFLKQLGLKDQYFLDKNMKELDVYARAFRYRDLAMEQYANMNFLFAEQCFLEAAKCYESMKGFYGAEKMSLANASLAYRNAGMSTCVFDAERAMKYAKRAHEINPHSELPLELMGICAWKLHQFEDAVSYFKQALSIKEKFETFLQLESLYLILGDRKITNETWVKLYKKCLEGDGSGKSRKFFEFEKLDQLQELWVQSVVCYNKGKFVPDDSPIEKSVFLKSGYDFFDRYELPFDEFCTYLKNNNKTYLVRYYYYLGNKHFLYAMRIMPYENIEKDDYDICIKVGTDKEIEQFYKNKNYHF